MRLLHHTSTAHVSSQTPAATAHEAWHGTGLCESESNVDAAGDIESSHMNSTMTDCRRLLTVQRRVASLMLPLMPFAKLDL
jgi:hypothetical protein